MNDNNEKPKAQNTPPKPGRKGTSRRLKNAWRKFSPSGKESLREFARSAAPGSDVRQLADNWLKSKGLAS